VILTLRLRPRSGVALASWDDLGARVSPVFPRARAGFGVQEIWAHQRFFLRTMLTEMPSPHFPLSVFCTDGPGPKEDPAHPVWPLLARLAERNGWEVLEWSVVDWRSGGAERPLPIPDGAGAAPMPEDHHLLLDAPDPGSSVDLDDLDDVRWSELGHAFGAADDVPARIRAVASHDANARREAYRSLYGTILHQGSIYPATIAAIPFLLRVLAHGPGEGALDLLWLLVGIGQSLDPSAASALAEGEALVGAIGEREDEVGLLARRAIACMALVSESAAERLERTLRSETVATRRADWLYWTGQLGDGERWTALIDAELAHPSSPEARLGAALASARRGRAGVAALDAIFEAIEAPGRFASWTGDEAAWEVADHGVDDIGIGALGYVAEDELVAAIAAVGGAERARTRWPALPEIVASAVRYRRAPHNVLALPAPAIDARLLELLPHAPKWPAQLARVLEALDLPGTPEALAHRLARAGQ
jgi:hypothetical protein